MSFSTRPNKARLVSSSTIWAKASDQAAAVEYFPEDFLDLDAKACGSNLLIQRSLSEKERDLVFGRGVWSGPADRGSRPCGDGGCSAVASENGAGRVDEGGMHFMAFFIDHFMGLTGECPQVHPL